MRHVSFLLLVLLAHSSLHATTPKCAARLNDADFLANTSLEPAPKMKVAHEGLLKLTLKETFALPAVLSGLDPRGDAELLIALDGRIKIIMNGQHFFGGYTDEGHDVRVTALEFSKSRHRFLISRTDGRRIVDQIVINVLGLKQAHAWMRERAPGPSDRLTSFRLMAKFEASAPAASKLKAVEAGLIGEAPDGQMRLAELQLFNDEPHLVLRSEGHQLGRSVAIIKITPEIYRAIADGRLEDLDGAKLEDPAQYITFSVDGNDHRGNVRLRILARAETITHKLTSCVHWTPPRASVR